MSSKLQKIITAAVALSMIISLAPPHLFLPQRVQAQSIGVGDVATIIGGGVGLIATCELYAREKKLINKPAEEASRAADEATDRARAAAEQAVGIAGITGADNVVPVADKDVKRAVKDVEEKVTRAVKDVEEKQEEINCIDKVKRFLLASLKKRILDMLADETVKWIQGEGSPRFVTDPGRFFEDAAQAAIGDTARDIGLGELCSAPLKLHLQAQLQRPVFSQRVSCTLDNIVENISAFGNNFRNGSWVAYQEALKPQNNRWGLELLTLAEMDRRVSARIGTARYEASVGDGFLAQKVCQRWEQVLEPGQAGPPGKQPAGDLYKLKSPDGFRYTGETDRPAGSNWRCVESQTVTPGTIVGTSIERVIGSDFDFIVNADDITNIATIVANAVVNRITKEATGGLAGLFTPSDPGGSRREPKDCNDIADDDIRELCLERERRSDQDKTGFENRVRSGLLDVLANALVVAEDADTRWALNQTINNTLIVNLKDLISCQNSTGNVIDAEAGTKLDEANLRTDTIAQKIEDVDALITRIKELQTQINGAADPSGLADAVNAAAGQANDLLDKAEELSTTLGELSSETEGNLNQCQNP